MDMDMDKEGGEPVEGNITDIEEIGAILRRADMSGAGVGPATVKALADKLDKLRTLSFRPGLGDASKKGLIPLSSGQVAVAAAGGNVPGTVTNTKARKLLVEHMEIQATNDVDGSLINGYLNNVEFSGDNWGDGQDLGYDSFRPNRANPIPINWTVGDSGVVARFNLTNEDPADAATVVVVLWCRQLA